jgi:hypothetical protein
MRFNVSVDFTEEEIAYPGMKAIIKSLSGMDPQNILAGIQQGMQIVQQQSGVRPPQNGRTAGPYPGPFGIPLGPQPMPAVADIRPASAVLDKCLPIDVSRHMEASFVCCKCATVNAEERAKCRHCGHDRCGVIITPPPSPEPA